jgi:Omp85 superfamily domain
MWHRRPCIHVGGTALMALWLLGSSADAQESRAAEIAAEQARQAAQAKPYEPSSAERWAVALRREFLTEPSGFYPYFASVYSGGGFTLGAGYRQFYGDRTHWDVKGLYSIKSYKLLEFSTDSWGHAAGRLDLHGRLGWRDATQVAYYGLGIDSPDARSNFQMKQAYVGGDLQVRPGGYTVFGAGVMYEDYTLEPGAGHFPSIEESFTPATAPGLGASPTYVHMIGSAGIDWRPSPGYARRGGLYQISYHNFADRNETNSFDRIDGEIVQHLPILRENWVVSLHGLVQTTLDDDDVVPYFLLPSLGSGSTLRAYPSWRFRDRHSLLMSGEFRWIPSRLGIDMALFYDVGKVTSRWDDLSLTGLKSSVGVGIRFHSPIATPLRIELAHGREGLHLVFAGSAAF